jgi:hypothetical protein
MKSACYITETGNPATSVPCGFSKNGSPIGIQIVGRNHDDWGVASGDRIDGIVMRLARSRIPKSPTSCWSASLLALFWLSSRRT